MTWKAILLPCLLSLSAAAQTHWVVAWGAAPAPLLPVEQLKAQKLGFDNQTVREIVHTSLAGDSVRVRLSNAYGTAPLHVGGVHLALRASGSGIAAGTDRPLTFGGRASFDVPPDSEYLSDPVKLAVPAAGDLAVSIFLPGVTPPSGIHYAAQQTSYVASGDALAAPAFDSPSTIASWVFLTGVEVLAPASTGAIVTFGDSITDGAHSTSDTNHRWPDVLAGRLHARNAKFSVVNMGIGGNRILHDGIVNPRYGVNALARFDRDVLAQPGVRYLVILEGINDIGHPGSSAPASDTVSAEDLIAGYRQMIERAHQHGIRVIGATLTPFERDNQAPNSYYTPEKEKIREAVNQWIRTSGLFDGVVDFERAVQDLKNPRRIQSAFDSGDQLHPSDAGYKAMGEAIDLALFR